MKIRERLMEELTLRGHPRREDRDTRKYVVFEHTASGKLIYLGKGGAFRMGKNLLESIPHDNFKREVLRSWEERQR